MQLSLTDKLGVAVHQILFQTTGFVKGCFLPNSTSMPMDPKAHVQS